MAWPAARAYPDELGDAACPCLNASAFLALAAATNYAKIGGSKFDAFVPTSRAIPPSYGQSCRAHDVNLEPYCEPQWCAETAGECMSRWCAEAWCWVDSNNCGRSNSAVASSYFAHIGLTFSYETCNATNVFSDFYAAIMAPKPPPPAFPPPPTSPPPYRYEAEIGLGSTGGALLLVALLGYLQHRFLGKSLVLKQQKAAAREQATVAMGLSRRLRYVASFISAKDFLELGELVPHELLRNEGKLVYRDSFDDLAKGSDYTIFISHQWTSFQFPDPSQQQYAVMCAAVRRIAEEKLPETRSEEERRKALDELLQQLLVWVDYLVTTLSLFLRPCHPRPDQTLSG